MHKANCGSDKHLWVCKEESGFLSEISAFHPISAGQPVCPKGVIICRNCGEHLNKNKPQN